MNDGQTDSLMNDLISDVVGDSGRRGTFEPLLTYGVFIGWMCYVPAVATARPHPVPGYS
jgi:hypothetical protein